MRTLAVCAALASLLPASALRSLPRESDSASAGSEETAAEEALTPVQKLRNLFGMPLPPKIDLKHRKNQCKGLPHKQMCNSTKDPGFSAGLVVASYLEDLAWLNELEWDGNISVYVHDRSADRSHGSKSRVYDSLLVAEESEKEVMAKNENRTTPVVFQTIPNKGDEATAYLSYIIQKYYKLPDVVFFVQGHRCADHAKFDMARVLPNIRRCFDIEKGYLDVNRYDGRIHLDEGPHCKSRESLIKNPIMGYKIDDLQGIWDTLFLEEFGTMPDQLCWDGYAQFAVKKELILRHPLGFYKKLFKGVVNKTTTMEFFWRMTFQPSALRMNDHSEEDFEAMKQYVLSHR
mmetsp:Transcript_69536/g.214945  ORF Transcript_69536/g.214945 Transcript_69536/m.214945 type:complete len:346 (-) Transcript_69536:55-1092(-)|eukprot:CAMPEP_0204532296 /NCGR_PEP_ID=MMETSP0661-20131031/11648_1 /ASSEMBLY_ACC=CAM_ASM_000606 /TAXON_ID=109239 /ORGANISM="Alexandrium margalefi, Strain AMGDE01CS-322" /LENGTH=345 /DNA_ID=CAMNT_0051538527 /DNA_START=69 /DNA_END=1106 /DNA_ORIENTATION=-